MTDFGNGTYEASVFAKTVGTHAINAFTSISGRDYLISNMIDVPWTLDFAFAPASSHTASLSGYAMIAGVVAGNPTQVVLKGDDAAIKKIVVNLDPIQRETDSATSLRTEIKRHIPYGPRNKKRHVINFVVYKIGTYRFHIFLNSSMVMMPAELRCHPGAMSASWSGVRDTLVAKRRVVEPLIIQARDKFGNNIDTGGEAIRIQLHGAIPVSHYIKQILQELIHRLKDFHMI
mmetsp:Transcript_4287/g.13431  ORF Transcript_4287/g.13431 Transcript_4287/m.13431 type:complete len:232 (+) Transcript_4287:4995-5690(+)